MSLDENDNNNINAQQTNDEPRLAIRRSSPNFNENKNDEWGKFIDESDNEDSNYNTRFWPSSNQDFNRVF